jgi:alcohol dehydrogenase
LNVRAAITDGEWVTVVGVGGVGLSAVQIAVAAGARVIAVDRTSAALALARRLGAEHTVLAERRGERSDGGERRGERSDGGEYGADVAARVHDLTGGGSHVAVDAVGSPGTCADAIYSLRRRGRHVQVGLLPSVGGHPAVPMDRVIAWELDVLGSHGMAAVDYPHMLRLVEAGTLRPQDLVERVVGLAEGARLLPTFDAAAPVGVTLIDPRLP